MGEAKERGILYSAPMVLAKLAGTKTQTRRVFKPQPSNDKRPVGWGSAEAADKSLIASPYRVRSPYGMPGDRLWGRETWAYNGQGSKNYGPKNQRREGYVTYAADNKRVTHYFPEGPVLSCPKQTIPEQAEGEDDYTFENRKSEYYRDYFKRWRPSIFMPRWASRILDEIVSVWVERLQDITDDDARAEGLERRPGSPNWFWPGGVEGFGSPRACYLRGWDTINGRGAAEKNPWVWVIETKAIRP